jgi:hypothetical protein
MIWWAEERSPRLEMVGHYARVREGVTGRESALPHGRATDTPRGDCAKLVKLGLVSARVRCAGIIIALPMPFTYYFNDWLLRESLSPT